MSVADMDVSSSTAVVNRADRPAQPLHVQRLQRMLDMDPFLMQLEALLSSPIKSVPKFSFSIFS
jgi:hypothetical protein